MGDLGLTYEEMRQVLRLCHHVRVNYYPPRFDLKAFLVGLFQGRAPSTAERIENLDERQMRCLCQEIIDHQKWTC